MAIRYAVGSGVWSNTTTVWSNTDGGTPGNYVPGDGDTFVICAGVNVQVDVDQSSWTGLSGANIIRGGELPGMLYWMDGTSGILKLRTGSTIQGTADVNKGRLLANSDGVWSTDEPLEINTKSVIMLVGNAHLSCIDLDVKTLPSNPTNKYIRVYDTKYAFDTSTAVNIGNSTIDLGVTPPPAGSSVKVMPMGANSVLPGGLYEEVVYYIISTSGTTCKLSLVANNASTTIVLTDTGSGNVALYTGVAKGATVLNTLEDITEDSWEDGDMVSLANVGPASADNQATVLTINSSSQITIEDGVDSVQYPLTRVYLITRNVTIMSSATSTSQNIVFRCTDGKFGLVCSTSGVYCNGFSNCTNCEGIVVGCYNGFSNCANCVGDSVGCYNGFNSCTDCNGFSIGCNNGFNGCTGCVGDSAGCTNGFNSCNGCYGNTIGDSFGFNYCMGCVGNAIGNSTGFSNCSGCSGSPIGVLTGLTYCVNCHANPEGCHYAFIRTSFTCSRLVGNIYDFRNYVSGTLLPGGYFPNEFSWHSRNVAGQPQEVLSEYHKTFFQACGDSIQVTAGSGAPVPNQRNGGGAELVELSNLQTSLGPGVNKLKAWADRNVRIWASALKSRTYRFYIQSTMVLSSDDISLIATYYNAEEKLSVDRIISSESISIRAGLDDWDNYLEVMVNPLSDGWVVFELELYKYGNSERIWIDPAVSIS